jgi:hypothetical protein
MRSSPATRSSGRTERADTIAQVGRVPRRDSLELYADAL